MSTSSTLPPFNDYGFCVVSIKIIDDQEEIGYMYRQKSISSGDSGWRFFQGNESAEDIDNPSLFKICLLSSIIQRDEAIVTYLNAPIKAKFERITNTKRFRRIKDFRWYLEKVIG